MSKKQMRLPNNYGGIVYLGENRRKPYAARITIGFEPKGEKNGVMQYRQKYKYLGFFEKRTQAMECLMEYNKNPYDVDQRKLTFKEIHDKWSIKHYEKVSPNTIKTYKTAFNKCESIYNVPFADLKTKHLQEVIDHVNSASVCIAVKSLFGLLYKYAMKDDIVVKDYSKFVDLPKVDKIQPPKPFTKDEIKKLWSMEGNEYIDMYLILLYTGMRITELLMLETKNIHLDKRYMVGGIKTEAGENRVIPIHREIEHIIKRNMFEGRKYLFFSRTGNHKHYTNVRKKADDLLQWANLDHTFHDTRHTFVSQCSRLNFNEVLLKRIVGHSDKDVTQHYTHKDINDLILAIDSFYY